MAILRLLIRGSLVRAEHFACKEGGSISLWNLYNLLTEANKSSYVDSYLDRYTGIEQLIHLAHV